MVKAHTPRVALLAVLFAAFSSQAAVATLTTFNFTGNCTDCTGKGTATLVLQNYTPGTTFNSTNFVSLSYSSNLLNLTLTSSDNPNVTGLIPANLPAAASVNIFANPCCSKQFFSSTNGTWCSGLSCGDDTGTGGAWSFPSNPGAGPTATGVPALTDVTLG